MSWIRKTVLTPVKWGSKKLIHSLLLSFPGDEKGPTVACVYCPEMCRFSCGPAVVTGNDAVTPCNKMTQLHARTQWEQSPPGKFWSLYDCTGCGRCTEYCVHGVPVADRLFEARSQFKNENAEAVLARTGADIDPAGDLAYELGDVAIAKTRLAHWRSKGIHTLVEPKAVYFARQQGDVATWMGEGRHGNAAAWHAILNHGSRLRVLDSVWLERRLFARDCIADWIRAGEEAGVQWVRTRASVAPPTPTADLEDAGLEGAYPELFPENSRQMLREIWSQIPEDAYDQVWVWSPRARARLSSWMQEGVIPQKPVASWETFMGVVP